MMEMLFYDGDESEKDSAKSSDFLVLLAPFLIVNLKIIIDV